MAYDMFLGRETTRDWSCGIGAAPFGYGYGFDEFAIMFAKTQTNIENTVAVFDEMKRQRRVSPNMDAGFMTFLSRWKAWSTAVKSQVPTSAKGLFSRENRDLLKLFKFENSRWNARFMSLRTPTRIQAPTPSPRTPSPRTVSESRDMTPFHPPISEPPPMPKWAIFLAVGLGAALLGIFAGKP